MQTDGLWKVSLLYNRIKSLFGICILVLLSRITEADVFDFISILIESEWEGDCNDKISDGELMLIFIFQI